MQVFVASFVSFVFVNLSLYVCVKVCVCVWRGEGYVDMCVWMCGYECVCEGVCVCVCGGGVGERGWEVGL